MRRSALRPSRRAPLGGALVAGSVASLLLLADASPAFAQTAMGDDLSPTGKGIAGCALLGGEAALLIEAAAGVDATWAYIVFPLLGAAGGGVGGFFLEDAGESELAVASLALGVALIIPTTVLVLSATSYDPGDDEEEGASEEEDAEARELDRSEAAEERDRPSTTLEAPASEPPPTAPGPAAPEGGGASPQSRLRRGPWRRHGAPVVPAGALVSARADHGFSLGIGVPAISVTTLHDAREQATMAQLGVRVGGTEVRVDLLRLAF